MRSSPADLVLSHALACAPLAPPALAPVAPSFPAPSAPAAASSAEPLLFPPSSFPYPRLLPVVVFARSRYKRFLSFGYGCQVCRGFGKGGRKIDGDDLYSWLP